MEPVDATDRVSEECFDYDDSPGRVDKFFNTKRPGDRPVSLTLVDVPLQMLNVIYTTERCHIESIYLKAAAE